MRFPWFIFPIASSLAWGITILTLLFYWLGSGRQHLASQLDEHIPYISDIGAFKLKPLFVTGAILTVLSYLVVLFRIQVLPFRRRWALRPRRWMQLTASATAIGSGIVASLSLILLTGLDTYRFFNVHMDFLYVFTCCMLLSAFNVAIAEHLERRPKGKEVEKEATDSDVEQGARSALLTEERPEARWRVLCKRIIIILIPIEIVLAILFLGLFKGGLVFAAGCIEWILAGILVPYLWLTTAYIEEVTEDTEQTEEKREEAEKKKAEVETKKSEALADRLYWGKR